MKALAKVEAGPGLTLIDLPRPEIGPHDILIRVKAAAICGTDVHIYKWNAWAERKVPLGTVLGHEFMGEVVEMGQLVTEVEIGDRVCGEGHLYCGVCRNCREDRKHLCSEMIGVGINHNGAFAEYVAIPARNAFPLPEDIPDEIGAICDPLGNATQTALSFDVVGEDVLITGAGPIGIMAGAICQRVGARTVTVVDLNPYRLDLARSLGIEHTINLTDGPLEDQLEHPVTVALEMSGAPQALQSLVSLIEPGGRVALLGLVPDGTGIPWSDAIFKGLTLRGIYGRKIFTTWYKLIHLLESGLDLSGLITHRFPLSDYESAFEAMMGGRSGKILLIP